MFSVIISTYTRERVNDVKRCIESLYNQTLKPYEVILVLDPDDELVKFYKKELSDLDVKIVKSDKYGLSSARNKGVEVAESDFIAFIDDDAYADKHWLENISKNFNDESVWVVGGKIIPVFDSKRPKWLCEELDWIVGCTYKGMPECRCEVRNPIGANMAFRKDVFKLVKFEERIGRFGKLLMGSEETELCIRLKKKRPDVKIIYDPSAIVYHRVPKERAKMSYALRRAFYEGYSKALIKDLTTERGYLKFLAKSMLSKIGRLKLIEMFGILLIILTVAVGYLYGKFNEFNLI